MSDDKPGPSAGFARALTGRTGLIFFLLAAPAVMMTVFFILMLTRPQPAATASLCPAAPVMTGEALIGGEFELVDHRGETFTEADLLGRPSLIFFGFTFCPDVCPFALQSVAVSLDALEPEQAERFRPVFISIDPERDTVESMAAYVESNGFPDGLIGLTGTPEQVAVAADAYAAIYRRAETEDAADYLMDHSAFIYLMDADGRFVRIFRHGESPMVMADCLKDFLEEETASS